MEVPQAIAEPVAVRLILRAEIFFNISYHVGTVRLLWIIWITCWLGV